MPISVNKPNASARRSRVYRERMRAAGYRAAEVWRLDTSDDAVRSRIERQLQRLGKAADDTDWSIEPEFPDWR